MFHIFEMNIPRKEVGLMSSTKQREDKLKRNESLRAYQDIYKHIEKATKDQIEQFGLPLAKEEIQKEKYWETVQNLENKGALVRNNRKSIVSNGKISSACEACQTGKGSYTSFISLKCHRDCYFCFNKNQDDYTFYLNHQRNTNQELEDLINQGVKLTHLALTGGEPLLHPEETIQFFELAQKLTPESHTRLYTTGDFLNEDLLQRLKETSLDEIRFSIKLEDSTNKRKHILRKIELANKYIPDVMVEMPIIPGTGKAMKELLLELDELDIFGINLLEFCYPFENAHAFKDRGYELKNPPYDVYYNFWYAGGLAVAESEKLCLDLVEFAIEKELKLGVHYCSLENKFTGQIYQQNFDQVLDDTYLFSKKDYYFKTAKVFGADKEIVEHVLKENNQPFNKNDKYDFLQFSVKAIEQMEDQDLDILISSNVVENEQQQQNIREVHLEWIKPAQFDIRAL